MTVVIIYTASFNTKSIAVLEDQTKDHLIFECELLTKERERERERERQAEVDGNRWPTNKQELIRRH
jgi:hypothetical protein